MFKVLKIDHVAVAVKDITQMRNFYADRLGIVVREEEKEFPAEKVKICLLSCGDSDIELVESITPDGPTAKLVENKGGGLHHIALLVDNLRNAVNDLGESGIRFLGDSPHQVVGGPKVAFIHPKDAGSTLIELVEQA